MWLNGGEAPTSGGSRQQAEGSQLFHKVIIWFWKHKITPMEVYSHKFTLSDILLFLPIFYSDDKTGMMTYGNNGVKSYRNMPNKQEGK